MKQIFKEKVPFAKEMKKTHTILAPMMLPIHFKLLVKVLEQEGYKVELLETTHRGIVDEGLRNVHNDTCYPALLVIGQLLDALKSGRYDPDKTALLISQTGGGCRASNYIALLRKALEKNGYGQVPVLSLNFSNLERNSGFYLSLPALLRAVFAVLYGDFLMAVSNQCFAYEVHKGDTRKKIDNWVEKLSEAFKGKSFVQVKKYYREILNDFASIKRTKEEKVRVGIVGEIYVKYAPLGNNNLEDYLLSEDAEVVSGGLLDFCLYCVYNGIFDKQYYGKGGVSYHINKLAAKYLISRQRQMIRAIQEDGRFRPMADFSHTVEKAADFISHGVKMGEGWLLTAEMLELIDSGVDNIIATQPFGCLPNHIVAKGMVRKIKDRYPRANIVAVDYDPGATRINQENRIKLMLANARLLQETELTCTEEPGKVVSLPQERLSRRGLRVVHGSASEKEITIRSTLP